MPDSILAERSELYSSSDTRRYPLGILPEESFAPPMPWPMRGRSGPTVERGVAVFRLEAPGARSVKLLGDFTGWDDSPVELIRRQGDVWQAVVYLPPGRYEYGFLVDDVWHEDPEGMAREANPFGTYDAVLEAERRETIFSHA